MDVAGKEPTARMLWDIESIKQLKARYCRLLDTKSWNAFQDLFTPDCVHHLPASLNKPPLSNEQYFGFTIPALSEATTVHHGHMPEITLLGDDEAEAIWAVFDDIEYRSPARRVHGYGHYFETYRKCVGGVWRISSKRTLRHRQDPVPVAAS